MDSDFWQHAQSRAEKARLLLRRRRPVEALEELRAAAEMEPHHAGHHYELGRCLSVLGRLDEANEAFGRAAEEDPQQAAFAFAHGETLLALRRWREAIDAFDAVSQLDTRDDLALVRQLECHAELGEHDRAEELFYQAIQIRDNRPAAYYHVGRSLAARGRHERALWCWDKTRELVVAGIDQPLATLATLRSAESSAALGKLDEAKRLYLQVLRRDPQERAALLGLAELLLESRRFDAAGDRIKRAVRLDPDDPRGHFLAGRWYLALGRFEEASVALRRVIELETSYPLGHLLLARLALKTDDAVAVRRHCRAEMMRHPSSPETLHALADMLLDVGDLSRAIACLERLVAVDSSDSRGWQNLGVARCWQGDPMAGIIASRRALRLDPTNLAAANNLGLALLELCELDAAARVIREGLEVDPKNALLRRLRLRLRVARVWSRIRGVFRRESE
jgi:tetratricopeptide (TPR) repeat protein